MASDSARVCFVHVQKTGGLTIEEMLRGSLPDFDSLDGLGRGRHAKLAKGLEVHPHLADYWIFGFVRNPWARLYSWWSMVQRRLDAAAGGNEYVAKRLSTNPFWRAVGEYDGFEPFVLRGMSDLKRLRTPQLDYLVAGPRRADFIGRTESLTADMAVVFERLGLPAPESAPHNNAGVGGSYRDHFTPAMRDLVARHYRADLDEFGYEF